MKKLVALFAFFSLASLPLVAGADQAATAYTLKVEAPPAKKGQKSVAKIKITPGAGYHMTKVYPTSLTLSSGPAGVTVDKTKLTMKNAAKWEEQGGVFDVAYTATDAGKKTLSGKIKFAV